MFFLGHGPGITFILVMSESMALESTLTCYLSLAKGSRTEISPWEVASSTNEEFKSLYCIPGMRLIRQIFKRRRASSQMNRRECGKWYSEGEICGKIGPRRLRSQTSRSATTQDSPFPIETLTVRHSSLPAPYGTQILAHDLAET